MKLKDTKKKLNETIKELNKFKGIEITRQDYLDMLKKQIDDLKQQISKADPNQQKELRKKLKKMQDEYYMKQYMNYLAISRFSKTRKKEAQQKMAELRKKISKKGKGFSIPIPLPFKF